MMNEALKRPLDRRRTSFGPAHTCSSSSALHVYVTAGDSPGHVQRRGPITSRGVFDSREFPARNLVIGARGPHAKEFAFSYITLFLSLLFVHHDVLFVKRGETNLSRLGFLAYVKNV